MTTEAQKLARSMQRFAATRRRRIAALAAARAAGVAVVAAIALAYADVLLQLPGTPRLALLLAGAAVVCAVAVTTYVRNTRAVSETRLIARLVEQAGPSRHNELINAIDFEDMLESGQDIRVSRPLMEREVQLASAATSTFVQVDTLTPPSLRRDTKWIAVVLVLAAVLAVVFGDVFLAVAPRYFDPFGDHPPYSATKLDVEPAGVTIDYGEDVAVRVTAHGPQPEDVTLVLEDESGAVLSELPMLRSTEGDYRQSIDRATRDATYYARIAGGRSKRYALAISKAPRIGAVNVTYTYPEYTKLPTRTRQLGPDAVLRAYEGTNVSVSITSNRSLKGGTLRVDAAESDLAVEQGAQSVVGSFTVERAAAVEARIVDIEGIPGADVLRASVEVLPDEAPKLAVASPARQSFAIPTAEVPIEIEAQDDLGVANITLFRGLNGSGDLSKLLFTSDGGETVTNAVEVLDLADLGVRPGDVIDFYATVTDTFPRAPHTEATPSHQITIITEEQYRAFLQQETTADDLKDRYNDAQQRSEALAREQEDIAAQTQAMLNALKSGAPVPPEDAKKLAELAERQRVLAERTADAADALRKQAAAPSTFDIEDDFKKSLEEMAQRLDRARGAMATGAAGIDEAAQGQEGREAALEQAQQRQREALDQLGQNKKQFAERIEKPLDEIDRMYKLMEDVETFKAIYAAQVDLERQARSYRDVKQPSLDQLVRLKELGQAQQEVRSALIDLRANFEKHAGEIEAALPKVARDARAIAEGIDGRNIPTVMEHAMTGLASGDGADGHQNAAEAAHLLDQMIQRVNEASGAASETEQRLMITMNMNPGNTMSQLKNSARPAFRPGEQSGNSGTGATRSGNAFDVFGPEGSAKKPTKESALSRRRVPASAEAARDETEFAGAFEELDTDESTGPMIDAPAAEPVAEEYRPMIEAYFERIAEESQ